MHWTALLAKRFFPPEALVIDDVPCISCGYNLRGLRAVGYCPECNSQVGDSLFVLAKPPEVASGLRALGKGHLAFFGLLIGCLNSGSAWSQLVSVGILLGGAIWQLSGVLELRYRAKLENLPVISARLKALFIITCLQTAVLALWAAAILIIAGNPALAGAAAAKAISGCALIWVALWLASLLVAGWFGLALATIVGYGWMMIEFRVQLALAIMCAVAALPFGFVVRANLSPGALLAVAAVFGLPLLVTVLATTISLLHLGNAAEKSVDTMDDAISAGRVAIMPREISEYRDTSRPIHLTEPDGPKQG